MPKPRATWRALPFFYVCALFLNRARTRAWNQLARSPRPCWFLWQMWTAKAQESMCVCTISSGSRSLTKFKVDEDSSQIKNLDIYVRWLFLTIKNIKFLKMEHFNKLLSRSRPHETEHGKTVKSTSRNSLYFCHSLLGGWGGGASQAPPWVQYC